MTTTTTHPVAILNTSIATEDGTYRLRTITAEEARALVRDRELFSAIGHQATAEALTGILGDALASGPDGRSEWWETQDADGTFRGIMRSSRVPVNRAEFRQWPGQAALVLKLRGRLPEGRVLTLAELEELGFDLKVMERLS